MERAAEARHQKALAAKQCVHEKLEKDVRFRALYAAVAHTFADQLRQDLADLQAGKQVSSATSVTCSIWYSRFDTYDLAPHLLGAFILSIPAAIQP